MVQLSEKELKKLIQGGETNTVELKVAVPGAVEMAERVCGMANAQGGMIILGVKDAKHEIVGVPDHRIGEPLWMGYAGGEIRTLNPSRGLVFETSAYTVPPHRLVNCMLSHLM